MCEQLFLERSVWFDSETWLGRHPNALLPVARFEINSITAQYSIDYFGDRRQALPTYLQDRHLAPFSGEISYFRLLLAGRQRLHGAHRGDALCGELNRESARYRLLLLPCACRELMLDRMSPTLLE